MSIGNQLKEQRLKHELNTRAAGRKNLCQSADYFRLGKWKKISQIWKI